MKSMYIGSGDCANLLLGKNTKGFKKLLARFVSDEIPYYNSVLSPIDALRTGAILESRFGLTIDPIIWSEQYKVICREYDVLRSHLDFAKIEANNIVDFIELKTLHFIQFLELSNYREATELEYTSFIQANYSKYYNQVQFQLLCSGLESATLCFLEVSSYDDSVNMCKDITEDQFIQFRISRDNEVIDLIKRRAAFFQTLKNGYNEI